MPTFPAAKMDAIAQTVPGRIGFYVKDLNTGLGYEYNADEPLPTASVIKVAALIELFRQADSGELSFDDRYRLPRNVSSHGTGVLRMLQDDPELTVRDYCRLMMAVSDNMATDTLVGLVTPDSIGATMERMGFHNTRMPMPIGVWHYLMEGITEAPSRENDELKRSGKLTGDGDRDLPFASSLDNNVASARDLGRIMEMIHLGEMISADVSAQMLEMMKVVKNPNRIRQFLKPEIEAARKTGGSGRIKADTGVVYLPSGPVVIGSLATTDTREESQQGMDAIGDMSRLVYETLSPESVLEST